MKPNSTKIVGEDKLTRLVRLMKKYEDELAIVDGKVNLVLNSDGSGTLFAPFTDEIDKTVSIDMPVFDFLNTAILIEFLEASQLRRTLMIRS